MKSPERKKNGWLLAAAACAVLCSGCSGINASHSVSPASFFLPGLMKADPPPTPPDQATPLGTNLVLITRSR